MAIERSGIIALVRRLGAEAREAPDDEVEQLRAYFGEQILPDRPTRTVLAKHGKHVDDNWEWPEDTAPEQ